MRDERCEPEAGKTYRSIGFAMFVDYHPDYRGDPTAEVWSFRNAEDDQHDGDGWLEIFVKEIVQTQQCGTLAVYYRQWFNPEGERIWSRKRVIGNLSSLRALMRRRGMSEVLPGEFTPTGGGDA